VARRVIDIRQLQVAGCRLSVEKRIGLELAICKLATCNLQLRTGVSSGTVSWRKYRLVGQEVVLLGFSLIFSVAGILSTASGMDSAGLDFKGGTQNYGAFDAPPNVDHIRSGARPGGVKGFTTQRVTAAGQNGKRGDHLAAQSSARTRRTRGPHCSRDALTTTTMIGLWQAERTDCGPNGGQAVAAPGRVGNGLLADGMLIYLWFRLS